MSDPHSTPTPSERSDGRRDRTSDPKAALAVARATLYGTLSRCFAAPTIDVCGLLFSRGGHQVLSEAAHVAGGEPVSGCVEMLHASRFDLDELEAEQLRVFGHTARGEAPPYETEYGEDDLFQQPQELSDLAGFADAFGLRLRPQAHERIDHVSCECEMMAFLASKERFALETADQEMFDVTMHAEAIFLRDHLGRFAAAFAYRLARAEAGGFYSRLGRVLLALVTADCARFGVPLGSENLRVRLPVVADLPIGCSSCSELVPGAGPGAPEV